MTTERLIRRFHEFGGAPSDASIDADSLIGFFQAFRPDGMAIRGLYEELDVGDALEARLDQLYNASGDDRRPQGGKDAYFVIRHPPPIDPDAARDLTVAWLQGIGHLAVSSGDETLTAALDPMPSIRVLEGVPPKHPKDRSEKSRLLLALQEDASRLVERIDGGPYAATLRPAYYFTACDTMLRDYLMWPLYATAAGMEDPLEPYFELWRHGVKYRIFGETQIDIYLPRQQS